MTKALILAAGQGTRLRPITNDRPKCLAPFLGKTLLERQVSTLKSQNVTKIHIVTGYRSDQIEELGFDISFNSRFDSTNMVESLFSAHDFIKNCNEDLIIAYGDIIYKKENLQKLLSNQDEIALMIDEGWLSLWSLRLENPLDDAETLIMDDSGYITELGKKPDSYEKIQGQYTGLIKVRSDKIADFIDFYNSLDKSAHYDGNDFYNMYMTSFLQLLIDDKWKVKASIVNNGWLEVDSVDDLNTYERMAKNNELEEYFDNE
jgi:choline kinase